MSASWETRDIKLPFWLGEICLFKKTFRLQTSNVDFINFCADTKENTSPPAPDTSASGIMLYSLPAQEDHETLWQEDGYINYVSQSYWRYYIDLKTDYESYLDQFSPKTKSTFRRKFRKFEKDSGGAIDCRIYQTPDEIEEFYPLARAISKETYQEKLLDAGLPVDDGFKEDMMRHARNGTVRAFILFQSDKPVAYLYLPIFNNIVIYAYVGYLPEVGRLSAGTVLFLKALEYLFSDEDAHIFDFTEGHSDQKELFSTHNVYCVNLYKLEKNFANSFWLNLHRIFDLFSRTLNKILEKMGIKSFLKKLLRRQN